MQLLVKVNQTGKGDMAYQAGDVVAIKNDEETWGQKEGLPRFEVIHVPNMIRKEAEIYLDSKMDEIDGIPQAIRRRRKRLDLNYIKKEATRLEDGKLRIDKRNIRKGLELSGSAKIRQRDASSPRRI